MFRRYEDVIARAVNQFPDAVIVESDTITPTTLLFNIRSALNSFRQRNWSTNLIPRTKWELVKDKLQVQRLQYSVRLGPRQPREIRETLRLSDKLAENANSLHVSNPSEDVLRAICVLHHHGVLRAPSILDHLSEEALTQLSHFECAFDIGTNRENNQVTII